MTARAAWAALLKADQRVLILRRRPGTRPTPYEAELYEKAADAREAFIEALKVYDV